MCQINATVPGRIWLHETVKKDKKISNGVQLFHFSSSFLYAFLKSFEQVGRRLKIYMFAVVVHVP